MSGIIKGDLPGQVALREWVAQRACYWASPPYGTCEGCGQEDKLLGSLDSRKPGPEDATHCADCRVRASDRRAYGDYPCDKCEQPGAFRDPAHREDIYLCRSCHAHDGYYPSERAMITKVQKRVGAVHSLGRQSVCRLRDTGTKCGGVVKQRARFGEICARHWDPKKYDANKGP